MPLFKKSKSQIKPSQDQTQLDPTEKEINSASQFSDEKIPNEPNDGLDTPAGEGTMSSVSTQPPEYSTYAPGGDNTYPRQESSAKSAVLSSKGSSSDVGPDTNPITRKPLIIDDGIEVVQPPSTSSNALVPITSPLLSQSNLQTTRSYREYNFYYTNALTHLVICDPNQQALFFAEMSPFAKGLADVSLRELAAAGFDNLASKGPGLGLKEAQDAPVMATADTIPNTKHIKLGLGDPLQPENTTWIVMRNVHDDPKTNSRKYDMNVSSGEGKQTTYQWIQGAGGVDAAGSQTQTGARRNSNDKEAFRMISGDRLVASFRNASVTSVKKRGALRVYDTDSEQDSLALIFLCCSALCERQRRKKVKKGLLLGGGWSREK